MNVIISNHCADRMVQRGITRDDIDRALRCCFDHYPGDNGGTCHVGYGMDSRRQLKVWTMPPASPGGDIHKGDIIVKSAAWKGR
jgi:hypothetical protein